MHGSVTDAESESVILVQFAENQGFASNVQTRVMVIIMLWRSGRNDGLVVLVGCERNFAGSRIGSISDNRDMSTLNTFEQPRIKCFGQLELPLFLHNVITPVQMATAFPRTL